MMKKWFRAALILLTLLMVLPTAISAAPYKTYTYSIDGLPLESPDAYVPDKYIDFNYMGLADIGGEDSIDYRDLVVDEQQNIYLMDAGNRRVVVLDKYFKYKFSINSFINENGVNDGFSNPSGMFVSGEYIYVCDTDNARIVMFDMDGDFYKIIPRPESDLFEEGSIYKPIAMAADEYGRLFVVSSTTNEGIIVMSDEGEFQGYIGAQKVTVDLLDLIWRRFQTKEQREQEVENVAVEFNNIAIDSKGFVYATTANIDEGQQQAAINGKDTGSDYAPVKKLNAKGDDIMKRNGFYPPSGEVHVEEENSTAEIKGASRIVDVAVGPEETWSIVDEKRSKVYTYSANGELLFAFGDTGNQLGNISQNGIAGIVYQGSNMIILDKITDCLTVYKRTEYGDLLAQALRNQNERRYDMAETDWKEILKRNINFDSAYIGLGAAAYRNAEYEESMNYYQTAYDVAGYSESYREVRKEWIAKWIWTIPLFVIVLGVAIAKFLGYAKRVNKATQLKVGRKSFKEELLYVFHLIFHPFDGFWDLKHEQRGSVRAALVFLGLSVVTFVYQSIGQGYVMNSTGEYNSILMQALSILVPVALWVVANWALTTLFDGEGSFKDIFVATCYSLLPLALLIIPATAASNIVTIQETNLISMFVTIGFVWTLMLLFFGSMITHDYSFGKNILTTLGTIVGMVFIMFVGILFSALVSRMLSFISNIVVELTFRF